METLRHALSARRAYMPTSLAADAVLAALVVAIVGMMMVPLPAWLLDLLITTNLAISVLMLVVAVYVPDGLAFGAMPTVLLVTTLYRLALNVSTTRLILLHGDAGEVIRAFGHFVVQGNYIVGGVIFLILLLVQYVVVAKGAERVAEVGARFTLDAMPGKQMAIDAEVRQGTLSQEAARRARHGLQRESQFYGAMDGAMKFVKGDAIAGMLITVINLGAGVTLGVTLRALDASASLRHYGLLTIGDGLVSQIPSLLVSTSAGIVVTRVASEHTQGSLGSDVGGQLFGRPKVLGIVAGFLALLAIIPGLPALPFLTLAALGALIARRQWRSGAETASASVGSPPAWPDPAEPVVQIQLGSVGSDQAELLRSLRDHTIPRARARLFEAVGVVLPEVAVQRGDTHDDVVIRIQGVPIARQALPPGGVGDRAEGIATLLLEAAQRRAADLIGIQEVRTLLDHWEKTHPALVRAVIPQVLSLAHLSELLRRLVDEGIRIAPLKDILEALSTLSKADSDLDAVQEKVRARLSRRIAHQHAVDGVLCVHQVDPAIEDAVRDGLQPIGSGRRWALSPDETRDIVSAVQRVCSQTSEDGPKVLLTQADVRRPLQALLRSELPNVVVLSYQELASDIQLRPLAPVQI